MTLRKCSVVFLFLLSLSACSDQAYTPKPRGYPRISLPKLEYQKYKLTDCHYSFDLPAFATVSPDPYPLAEECWYNLNYNQFNATLHLSYRHIKDRQDLFKVLNDSREMVYKHVQKADEIIENYIGKPGKQGIFYELNGNTATNAQFYITDSTSHFLRGSLYFNSKTDQDSIEPVLLFLKKDMLHLIQTVEWMPYQ